MTYKADRPCVICNESRDNYVTYHHVYTQKSFPEYKDKAWNKCPVCQNCHNKIHNYGNITASKKFTGYSDWLRDNGWIVFNEKLINRNMYE
jgi:hypothetical protein